VSEVSLCTVNSVMGTFSYPGLGMIVANCFPNSPQVVINDNYFLKLKVVITTLKLFTNYSSYYLATTFQTDTGINPRGGIVYRH